MQKRTRAATIVLAWGVAALLALPAAAEPPPEFAKRSFKQFATSWMQRIGLEGANLRKTADATSPVTVRGADASFSTELQATGKPAAPYVGILNYVEHIYSCSGSNPGDCEILESSPVTEIFPLQNGKWKY